MTMEGISHIPPSEHRAESAIRLPRVGDTISQIPYIAGGKGEIISVDTASETVMIRSIEADAYGDYTLVIGPLERLSPKATSSSPAANLNRAPKDALEHPDAAPATTEANEAPHRPTMIMADTHGNHEIFRKNLFALEAVDDAGNWNRGQEQLVLLGDLIADRGTGDLPTMQEISRLRTQATEAGGEVVTLAGNHEKMLFAYLTNRLIGGVEPVEGYFAGGQAAGIGSLIERFMNLPGIVNHTDAVEAGITGPQLREQMLADPEGRAFLEEVCKMQLVHITDTTMFVHTDLTEAMADALLAYEPAELNERFQAGLRETLLEGKPASEEFLALEQIFLATGNRSYCSPAKAEALKNYYGITVVAHGHSDHGGQAEAIGGLMMAPLDISAGKGGKKMDRRSVGEIDNAGRIAWGKYIPEEARSMAA